MSEKVAVLITGMGSTTAMSVLKGLRVQREIPVEIIGADSNVDSAGGYWVDQFVLVPRVNHPSYLTRMLEICQQYGVRLVIPIVDPEFGTLARNRSQFEALGCKVAISDPETVSFCLEKIKTYAFFSENGIATPPTDRLTAATADSWEHFPAIVKPNQGSGTRFTYRVETRQELISALDTVPDPIVQKFMDGSEYTIDTLSDFTGQILASVPRCRIETRAGVCYKSRSVRDQRLIDLGVTVAERARLIGPACIQGFDTPAGFVFTEINPRFAGTLVMSLAAGVNTPLMLLKSALGEPVAPNLGDFREVRMVRYWDEIYYAVDQSSAAEGWELGWR